MSEQQENPEIPLETEGLEQLDGDLRKLQEERDALFQQLARVQADFRNARQRLESEKLAQIQFANTAMIKALLPIIDNFERGLEVDPQKTDVARLLQGMRIVYDQFAKFLADQQVEPIAPAPGDAFDPQVHEAIMQQNDPKHAQPTVVALLQKGYRMHGRTLRPAQVSVSLPQ